MSDFSRWLIGGALSAVVLASGCTTDPAGGDDDPPVVDPPPPAHPACHGASCLPGEDPCCTGTSCTNFGDFGGQVCAELCQTGADCESGCCVAGSDGNVCADASWCGEGGIYPEAFCQLADDCNVGWDDNQNSCRAYFESCLGGLNSNQKLEWIQAIGGCFDQSTCSAYYDCWLYQVPYC
jgi:hypothetical protein